jgi:hypothetical protein
VHGSVHDYDAGRMDFDETVRTMQAWVGQPVTLASWPIADLSQPWPHRPYHGNLERRQDLEGTPDIALFQVKPSPKAVEDDLPHPEGIDLAIGRSTMSGALWAPGAGGTVLRIRQGDVCMELILRVQWS